MQLNSKDIFINKVMLRAEERNISVSRKEVESCIDFNMKTGNYMSIDLILNMLSIAGTGEGLQ